MNLKPTRFRILSKFISASDPKILDIGCGSHSPSITKRWFAHCEYHGVDRERAFGNDETDLAAMDKFYEMDATALDFSALPDRAFHVIILSHIIEHLPNGDKVIDGLIPKLLPGGVIYVEFPSTRSERLPSMRGTLNFYDDPTHCRVFTRGEVERIVERNGCVVLRSHTRRDWIRIISIPLLAINSYVKYGYIVGSVFWDLLGFAEIVVAKKQ